MASFNSSAFNKEKTVKSKTDSLSKKISQFFNFFNILNDNESTNFFDIKKNELSNIFALKDQQVGSENSIFSYFYIGLLAKIASIDSPLNNDELESFISIITPFTEVSDKLKDIFFTAGLDPIMTEHYALKMNRIFPGRKKLYFEILNSLIKMAESDGPINNHEMQLLKSISKIFGFAPSEFLNQFEQYFTINYSTPYETLGVASNDNIETVNRAFKAFARKYHPDNYTKFSNIAAEYLTIMKNKFNIINEAYQQIKKTKR